MGSSCCGGCTWPWSATSGWPWDCSCVRHPAAPRRCCPPSNAEIRSVSAACWWTLTLFDPAILSSTFYPQLCVIILHHLLNDLLHVLVVCIVSWGSQDGAVVHLRKTHRQTWRQSASSASSSHQVRSYRVTFMRREMFLKRAREPYEPSMSAAMMTPPLNLTPSTDVPVTMGFLQGKVRVVSTGNRKWQRLDRWLRLNDLFWYQLAPLCRSPHLNPNASIDTNPNHQQLHHFLLCSQSTRLVGSSNGSSVVSGASMLAS